MNFGSSFGLLAKKILKWKRPEWQTLAVFALGFFMAVGFARIGYSAPNPLANTAWLLNCKQMRDSSLYFNLKFSFQEDKFQLAGKSYKDENCTQIAGDVEASGTYSLSLERPAGTELDIHQEVPFRSSYFHLIKIQNPDSAPELIVTMGEEDPAKRADAFEGNEPSWTKIQ